RTLTSESRRGPAHHLSGQVGGGVAAEQVDEMVRDAARVAPEPALGASTAQVAAVVGSKGALRTEVVTRVEPLPLEVSGTTFLERGEHPLRYGSIEARAQVP